MTPYPETHIMAAARKADPDKFYRFCERAGMNIEGGAALLQADYLAWVQVFKTEPPAMAQIETREQAQLI